MESESDFFQVTDAEKREHELFMLCLASITYQLHNGNINGMRGEYPERAEQQESEFPNLYQIQQGTYLGHNIAALAVRKSSTSTSTIITHSRFFLATSVLGRLLWANVHK